MKTPQPATLTSLPFLMAEITISSWEVILRRSWLIAQGQCSNAEGMSMMSEKLDAVMESAAAMAAPPGVAGMTAMLEPWRRRATANAKRLRRTQHHGL